jgi:hypothetical protein
VLERFQKFFPLVKVDLEKRLVYGMVTAEAEDKDGEWCHYDSTKPEYKAVNDELGKASDGENIMPLREMHQLNAVGAGKAIEFDDARKQIRMVFKVVDDSTLNKVKEKVLLGFSQGGRYLKRWTEGTRNYYTAQPGEVSLVDNPCLPGAFIEYVKADGSTEMFKTPENKFTKEDIEKIADELRKSLEKGVKYLATPPHLPYTDESGKPDHRLMGAAWAALHGGYRGNKYEGPGKEHAISRLKEIYHSEGMEPPSAKSLLDQLSGWEFVGDSELDTGLEKFRSLVAELMGKQSATGAADMNAEQIKKCAAALGISEEEFKKQFVDGDALDKGAKGLAALHAHLKKAHAHHEKMVQHHAKIAELHKAHGEMHGQMADHLENCMKAHGACMDGAEAEKILKALAAAPEKKDETTSELKKADVEKMLADGITAALAKQKEEFDKKLEDSPARLFNIPRNAEVKKAEEAKASDPLPV